MSGPERLVGLLKQITVGTNLKEAEKQISEYETQPGFAMALLQVLSNANVDPFVRQQAGLVLKKVLGSHWDRTDGRFKEPMLSKNEKESIKKHILSEQLIGDPNSKLRKSTAMIISVLAEFDYEDAWPNLLHDLLHLLKQADVKKNIHLLRGSITCIWYFSEHVDQVLLTKVIPILFPLLLQIVNDSNIPLDIKKDVFQTYFTLVDTLFDTRGYSVKLLKQLLLPTFVPWLKCIAFILNQRSLQFFSLQLHSVKTFHKFIEQHVKEIDKHLPQLLASMWGGVQFAVHVWKYLCILTKEERAQVKKDEILSQLKFEDEEDPDIGDLIDNIVRFLDHSFIVLEAVLARKEYQKILQDKLHDICDSCINLCMLTNEHLKIFNEEPFDYISWELDTFRANDLRASMRNVMGRILDLCQTTGYETLLNVAQKFIFAPGGDSNSSKPGMNSNFRELEAGILVFEYLADAVADISEFAPTQVKFPIRSFVCDTLFPNISSQQHTSQENPYLKSRALFCLNHFMEVLPNEIIQDMCQNKLIHRCLTPNNHIVVAYAATCVLHKLLKREDLRDHFVQDLRKITPLICQLLKKSENQESIQHALNVLQSLVTIDEQQTLSMIKSVIPLLLGVWKQKACDANISGTIRDVIMTFMNYNSCVTPLRQYITPPLMEIIAPSDQQQQQPQKPHSPGTGTSGGTDESGMNEGPESGIVCDALQMLKDVCDPIPMEGITANNIERVIEKRKNKPLNDIFYGKVLPCVLQLALKTKDHEIMENASQVVSTLIVVNPKRILSESNLMNGILQLCSKLLHPSIDDHACLGVGTLVSSLLIKLGNEMNESLISNILKALLIRAPTVKISQLQQQIIIIFARLHILYKNNIIQFLNSHNNGILPFNNENTHPTRSHSVSRVGAPPTGIRSLEYMMRVWCDLHNDLVYPYYKHISIVALCHILQNHDLNDKNTFLYQISVNGAPIIDPNTRQTRSRGQIKYTQVPLIFKILTFIIQTYFDINSEFPSDVEESSSDEDDSNVYDYEDSNLHDADDETEDGVFSPSKSRGGERGDEGETEDEDGEWVPTQKEMKEYKELDYKDYLKHSGNERNEEFELCPEAIDDPLYHTIQLRPFLMEFLRQWQSNKKESFTFLANQLSDKDQNCLKQILSM